jgi:hypothetical protein
MSLAFTLNIIKMTVSCYTILPQSDIWYIFITIEDKLKNAYIQRL